MTASNAWRPIPVFSSSATTAAKLMDTPSSRFDDFNDSNSGSSPIMETKWLSTDEESSVTIAPEYERWMPPKGFVYVRKPVRQDRERGDTTRTPNAFLLFRSRMIATKVDGDEAQQDISRVAGKVWQGLPQDVKVAWQKLALRMKRQHELNSPVQKDAQSRSPRKKTKRKTKKLPFSRSSSASSPVLSMIGTPRSTVPTNLTFDGDPPLDGLSNQILSSFPLDSVDATSPSSSTNPPSFCDPSAILPAAFPPFTASFEDTPFINNSEPSLLGLRLDLAPGIPYVPCDAPRLQTVSTLRDTLQSFETLLRLPGCDDLHTEASDLMTKYLVRLSTIASC